MTEIEKVLYGLRCRAIDAPSTCTECPYYNAKYYCCNTKYILKDALALLKDREPRVIELSEIVSTIYVWVEDRNEKALFPLKGGMIDPDGDEYFRFFESIDTDYIYWPTAAYRKLWRVWNLMPSPEQMRDTKWEEDNDAEIH